MADSDHPESADSDKTQLMPAARPSDLLRHNAGRIFGEMLGEGTEGAEREGDHIGPYRLCDVLGEGGFGNVWRAEETQVVRREVAVKVIRLGMDTVQVLGRFNQERQALASLDHPNIATLYNAGVTADGRPYFAMELVRGGPVTEWCESRSSPLQDRLRLFIQICQAVQHAHEKGILHRDLKPSNILVTEVDGQAVAKIIDFGIAKAIHSSSLNDLTLVTQADQVLGTPIYMAPEQIQGGQELDARCDVYALGVLLYELLTGAQPFDSSTLGSRSLDALKQMILETVPERPSTQVRRHTMAQKKHRPRLQNHLHSLPADLDWVTMRALEKDPLRRYASAAELAADVQRHLDCVPVKARPASVTYKASRWVRRHRAACVSASIGLALGLLVLVVPLVPWSKTLAAIRQASFFQPEVKAAPPAAAPATAAKADDRSAALWVLGIGGDVTIRMNNRRWTVKTATELPVEDFSLIAVVIDPASKQLDTISPLTGLTELEEIRFFHTDLHPDILAKLTTLPKLSELHFREVNLTDQAMDTFSKLSGLKVLNLTDTLSFTGTRLAELKDTQLERLLLSRTGATEAVFRQLTDLEHLTFLHENEIPVTDEGLARLRPLSQVRSLWWTQYSQDTARLIRQLAVLFPNLTTFMFSDSDPTHQVDLSTLGVFPQLRRVELHGAAMTDETLKSLQALPQIQCLLLQETVSTTESGMECLTQMPGLEEFISKTLTDGGLLKLTRLKTLKSVDLTHQTQVTAAGIEAFQRERPDVKVSP